jgi:acetyl-CoA carboxylase carboxyltransferase component
MIQKMIEDCAPYPAAGMHYFDDVIHLPETRDYLIKALGSLA